MGYVHEQAIPAIRAELCRAVRTAHDAKTLRDAAQRWGIAYGYANAIEILTNSADAEGLKVSGIARRDMLPMNAEKFAREFLKDRAEWILGPES